MILELVSLENSYRGHTLTVRMKRLKTNCKQECSEFCKGILN